MNSNVGKCTFNVPAKDSDQLPSSASDLYFSLNKAVVQYPKSMHADNKVPDQTALSRSLIWDFVVRIRDAVHFLTLRFNGDGFPAMCLILRSISIILQTQCMTLRKNHDIWKYVIILSFVTRMSSSCTITRHTPQIIEPRHVIGEFIA